MDEFSDDGFDDLNDTVLQELENNAIQATQAQRLAQSQAAPPPAPYILDDDDLDDTVVIDGNVPQASGLSSQLLPPPQQRVGAGFGGQSRWNQQPAPPYYPARPPYPPASRPAPAPAPPSQRYPTRPAPQPRPLPSQSQFTRPPPPPAVTRPYPAQPSQALHGAGTGKQHDIIAALQARLSALETELTSAKGEAAILRSKYDKAQLTHDAEMARLKQQNAEQLARQERAVESALAAERSATTELQFAHQDLREERGRAKTRRKDGGAATPRKSKSFGMVDGFDSVEMTVSPARGQAGQRRRDAAPAVVPPAERTPTKNKRKRPAVDSPTFALETHSGDAGAENAASSTRPPARAGAESLPYDFLKLALDHSAFHGQPLTFDLFSRFAFPSAPSVTFSSIIFQRLPQMGSPQEPSRLLVDFAELVIDLWQQCVSERYGAPVYYLCALVSYVLQLDTTEVAPRIISSLVPVCITTCELVALPRFGSDDGDVSQHPDAIVRQLDGDGDVLQSLALLHLAALGCVSSHDRSDERGHPPHLSPQARFWRLVDAEFVIRMLSLKHPEPEWFGMVTLLRTSVVRGSDTDTVGPTGAARSAAGALGAGHAHPLESVIDVVIERVSACLVESPRWAPPGSAKEALVRTAALRTLAVFATSDDALRHIARNNITLQRLVTVLCWAIDRLYDVDAAPPATRPAIHPPAGTGDSRTVREGPGPMQLDPAADPKQEETEEEEQDDDDADDDDNCDEDMPALLCRVISQAMSLLHALVTNPRCQVDMAKELATCTGGAQRYLLTLARLNFSEEDLVLEAGIDGETVDLAHELLEMAVTPDEGEAMGALFGV